VCWWSGARRLPRAIWPTRRSSSRHCLAPQAWRADLFHARARSDLDEDLAAFDLGRVGLQRNTHRCAERAAITNVESTVMFRALDHVLHHQPVAQERLLMGTQAVAGIDPVADAIHGKG